MFERPRSPTPPRYPDRLPLRAWWGVAHTCLRRSVESIDPPIPAPPRRGDEAFTVLTHNVNFCMPAAMRTVEALRRLDADVVCLQELNESWELLIRRELSGRYPHLLWRNHRLGGGLAVLSRFPARPLRWFDPPPDDATAVPNWLAEVDAPGGATAVLNVHLRPPAGVGRKLTVGGVLRSTLFHRDELRCCLAAVPVGRPLVVLGDFNEGDWGLAVEDLRRRGLQSPLRRWARRKPTWAQRHRGLPLRDRLDHILHTPDLRCLHAATHHTGGSDHFPCTATFARST